MKRRASRIERIFGISLVTAVVLWLASTTLVIVYGKRTHVEKSDAIVVLGAAQWSGRPSPVYKARLNHAIDLWNDRLAPLLVLTGGTGRGDTTTEAEVGKKYAMAHGVPESAILLENNGRSTSESLRTVAALMRARERDKVILVSDPFHMFRLRLLSGRFGLRAYTSPTPTSRISANPSEGLRYVLSESIKAPLAFILEKK